MSGVMGHTCAGSGVIRVWGHGSYVCGVGGHAWGRWMRGGGVWVEGWMWSTRVVGMVWLHACHRHDVVYMCHRHNVGMMCFHTC